MSAARREDPSAYFNERDMKRRIAFAEEKQTVEAAGFVLPNRLIILTTNKSTVFN